MGTVVGGPAGQVAGVSLPKVELGKPLDGGRLGATLG